MYVAIVFLPLLGFLIAGLFGRIIGERPSEIITTSLLFVSAALSWIAFSQVGSAHAPMSVPVICGWIVSGDSRSTGRCASTR
jgi:NADH-quinone oxidoreductase subunit L